jgi:hypothetical protein
MKTLPILQPTQYKNCIIVPVTRKKQASGFDVIDPSGQWFHVATQKQAKWWSAVHTRIQNEFSKHTPKAVPTPAEDHTPKPKTEKKVRVTV